MACSEFNKKLIYLVFFSSVFFSCESNKETKLFENKIKKNGKSFFCDDISYTIKKDFKSKNIYISFFEPKNISPFNDSNIKTIIPSIINNLYAENSYVQVDLDTLFILFEKEKIIEINIPTDELYAIIGFKFINEKEYIKAIESFSLAISTNSSNVNHYINRAISYYKAEQFIKSHKDFKIVLDIDSNNLKAYDGLKRIEKIKNIQLE